jgi:hypothetical protein
MPVSYLELAATLAEETGFDPFSDGEFRDAGIVRYRRMS